MIETIISNNCAGGAVLHELGMEFKTPTILLQILPEDFPRFCKNLKTYIDYDLIECHTFTPYEEHKFIKMFGGIPKMPIGLIGDVLVCFQHYETFEEAKKKWDERKARIGRRYFIYTTRVSFVELEVQLGSRTIGVGNVTINITNQKRCK